MDALSNLDAIAFHSTEPDTEQDFVLCRFILSATLLRRGSAVSLTYRTENLDGVAVGFVAGKPKT